MKNRITHIVKVSKAPFLLYFGLSLCVGYCSFFVFLNATIIQTAVDIVMKQRKGNLAMVLAGFVLSVGIYALSIYFSGILQEKIAQHCAMRLKAEVFEKCLCIPLVQSGKKKSGDYLTLLTNDSDSCVEYMCKGLLPVFQEILSLVSGCVFFLMHAWQFLFVMLLAMVPMFGFTYYYSSKIRSGYKNVQVAESARRSFFQEYHQNSAVIKAYDMKPSMLNKNEELFLKKKSAEITMRRNFGKMVGISNLCALLPTFILLLLGIYYVRMGYITFGVLFSLCQISEGSIMWPLSRLPDKIGALSERNGAMDRIVEALSISNEAKSLCQASLKSPKLTVSNLVFAYNDEDPPVLRGINFTCGIGDIIYITGESGSGKSTFTKLLLQLYQPREGEIYIDDGDRRIVGMDLRQFFSYVPQGNSLFKMTFAQNIGLGREGASIDDIEKAAKLAGIHDFIAQLQEGYNTQLETATSISEGQAQRIAIARALLKETPFIILDEPYSALDEQNEKLLMNTLREISQIRGCIVISHRLSSLSIAHRVITLDEGGF